MNRKDVPSTHVRDRVLAARLEETPLRDAEAEAHQRDCAECRRFVEDVEAAVQLFRSHPVAAPPALTALTRRRVREHVVAAREEDDRRRATVLASALACATSAAMLLATTRCAVWLVSWAGLPAGVAWTAIPVLWFLPATLAGFAALALKSAGSALGTRGGVE